MSIVHNKKSVLMTIVLIQVYKHGKTTVHYPADFRRLTLLEIKLRSKNPNLKDEQQILTDLGEMYLIQ